MSEKITTETIRKSQAKAKSNNLHDKVEVKIIKDGNHYRKGDVDTVHPATAEILRVKGLIK